MYSLTLKLQFGVCALAPVILLSDRQQLDWKLRVST